MLTMIGLWIAKRLGRSITTHTADQIGVGVVVAFMAVALAIGVWWTRHDAVSDYKDGQAAEQIEAEHTADELAAPAATAFASSQADIKEGMNDAKASDPAGASRPVGPVSNAYYERLRAQQRGKTGG